MPPSEPFMRVRYAAKGTNYAFVVDVLKKHFDAEMKKIATETPVHRARMKRSVNEALERAAKLARQGYVMTEEEQQNACDDVGIWFAYEVYEGRASFVPTGEA